MSEKNFSKTRILVECAIMIALGTILAQLKLFRMPSGGSVTAASMVPFLLISYRHGTKWGLIAGFTNSILQMLIGGIYPPIAPGAIGYVSEILLDYILAYMVLGLAFLFFKPFHKKKLLGIAISSLLCCILRFICAFISGFLVWADVMAEGMAAVVYSLGYNASYLLPETIITVVVITLLYKVAPAIFNKNSL